MTDLAMGGQTDAVIAVVSDLSQRKTGIAKAILMFFGAAPTGLRPGGTAVTN